MEKQSEYGRDVGRPYGIRRLQGKEWAEYRASHSLKLIAMAITKHGNYEAIAVDERGFAVRHYLNDAEVAKLKASGYGDVWDRDRLYAKGRLKKLFKKALESRQQSR